MSSFEFISDGDLRIKLENSIEFIYSLFERSKIEKEVPLYKEETYRVIILYVISVIEAILLYFYKERGEKIEHFEYKYPERLMDYCHKEKQNFEVVVAVREKIEQKENQVGLHALVDLFRSKNLIRKETADSILELNDIRNTFHLCKPRTKKCGISHVESALKLLVHTIENAPIALKIAT